MNNKVYKFTDNVDLLLSKKIDLMQFVERELFSDAEFLSMVDKTISPSNIKSVDKTKQQLFDDFVYYMHNGARNYILKIVVLKFVADKMCKNYEKLTQDPYWLNVVNSLCCE